MCLLSQFWIREWILDTPPEARCAADFVEGEQVSKTWLVRNGSKKIQGSTIDNRQRASTL